MQPLWLITEKIIRGKVVVSPKFEPWWILWIRVCPWFVHAPKMFKLCTNQFVVQFVQVHMNNRFVCHSSSPHPKAPTRSFYPWSVVNERVYPNSFFFQCFHFWTCIWIFQRVWGCVNFQTLMNVVIVDLTCTNLVQRTSTITSHVAMTAA
jgi:hypothetical protein